MNTCLAPCPVVFDLDGTLIDSAPDIHAAVNAVLRLNKTAPLTLLCRIGLVLPCIRRSARTTFPPNACPIL